MNVGVQITIPIFAAKTSANVALAKSQLAEAELNLGNKRQEVRLDVQQKARNVRELDATREVARLDLQLAQETVQSCRPSSIRADAPCRTSSRLGWTKTTNGSPSSTPISPASKRNSPCCRPPASSRKSFSSNKFRESLLGHAR